MQKNIFGRDLEIFIPMKYKKVSFSFNLLIYSDHHLSLAMDTLEELLEDLPELLEVEVQSHRHR